MRQYHVLPKKNKGLVPSQDGPFFYTCSHLNPLQNYALLFSTNYQFVLYLKMHNTI